MTDIEPEEDLPPVAHVTIVYTGPIAPHWDLRVRYGDQKLIDDFWARVNARLLLLPKHDPQFRRNKERVNRDAERERITCDWDLGEDDAETTITPVEMPASADGTPDDAVAQTGDEAAAAEPEADEVEMPVAEEATTDVESAELEEATADVTEATDASEADDTDEPGVAGSEGDATGAESTSVEV